jgi:hypothetical protein
MDRAEESIPGAESGGMAEIGERRRRAIERSEPWRERWSLLEAEATQELSRGGHGVTRCRRTRGTRIQGAMCIQTA